MELNEVTSVSNNGISIPTAIEEMKGKRKGKVFLSIIIPATEEGLSSLTEFVGRNEKGESLLIKDYLHTRLRQVAQDAYGYAMSEEGIFDIQAYVDRFLDNVTPGRRRTAGPLLDERVEQRELLFEQLGKLTDEELPEDASADEKDAQKQRMLRLVDEMRKVKEKMTKAQGRGRKKHKVAPAVALPA